MLGTQDLRDKDQLLSYLSEAYSGERSKPATFRSLHAFLLSINEGFTLAELVARAQKRGLQISFAKQGKDLYRLSVGVRTSNQLGFLVPIGGNWAFFADGETSEVTSTVTAFARRMFPILKLAYLPSPDLLGVIASVSKKYEDVVITEGTIRTENQTSRNWNEQPEHFTRTRMEQLAKRARGKWTGITFRCLRGDLDLLTCRVYETGHLTLYSGDFTHFFEDAIFLYLAAAERVRRKLEGKARKDDNGNLQLSPIPFRLPRQITSIEMDLLKNNIIRRYAASVMHGGNPMLMMEVTDSADGSAYDLYAYGPEVKIVPLQKSSAASLAGLLALVSDVLPTGTLAMA
jgi:hypothetical protein